MVFVVHNFMILVYGILAMELWRYLMEADRLTDLVEPGKAREWLRRQPWGPCAELTTHGIGCWQEGIAVLRFLAERWYKRRPRRPTADFEEADCVLERYISMMRGGPGHGGPGVPWIMEGWPDKPPGLRFFPTSFVPSTRRRGRQVLWHAPDLYRNKSSQQRDFWLDDGEVFWQIVFYQVLESVGPAVCRDCGRLLGELTPKGRSKKQSVCKTCKQRRWRAKQDPEEMAKKEHEQYIRRKKRKHWKRRENQE
jgi:hypothetical protein